MRKTLVAAAVCSALAMIALAAQNRGFEPRGPAGRLAAALDADRDGTISAAEMRSAAAALRTLDANGDGRLTGEELRRQDAERSGEQGAFAGRRRGDGAEAGGAPGMSADELADTLMAFDRNSDGTLNRSEVPERFQGLFNRADANKDGALTRNELKESASATMQGDGERGRRGGGGGEFGRGRGRGRFDPLMRALDSDRDGSLSDREIAAAAEALTSLDANQDGQLTLQEFAAPPGRGLEARAGGRR